MNNNLLEFFQYFRCFMAAAWIVLAATHYSQDRLFVFFIEISLAAFAMKDAIDKTKQHSDKQKL